MNDNGDRIKDSGINSMPEVELQKTLRVTSIDWDVSRSFTEMYMLHI